MRRIDLVLAVMTCLVLQPTNVSYADQVGTAVVDGRTVILERDKTWRYADAPQPGGRSNCDIAAEIELCIKQLGWMPVEKRGPFQFLYVFRNKFYLGIVQDEYGTTSGMTYDGLQAAIIANAAAASNTTTDQVPVMTATDRVENMAGARAVVYSVNITGVPLIYNNIYKINDQNSMQIVFWGVGKSISSELSERINEAVRNIKLK